MVDPAAARFDRVARAGAPQSWRGMTARRRRSPAVEDGCAGRGGTRGAGRSGGECGRTGAPWGRVQSAAGPFFSAGP